MTFCRISRKQQQYFNQLYKMFLELKVKTTNKYNSDSPRAVSFLFINLQEYKLYMYVHDKLYKLS